MKRASNKKPSGPSGEKYPRLLTLGPAGTFSHEAALSLYPQASIELCANFDILFETLQKKGGIGFVPVENSLRGSVDEVLDLLTATDVKIWRTADVAVHQAFGARDVRKVERVASHPQALGQCRAYLRRKHPSLERFPVSSTTFAVDLALKDPAIAAIASPKAMRLRGLPILEREIQGKGNTTRFALVAKEDPFPKIPKSHMSMVLMLHPNQDHPGLLHDLLTPFKIYDVNLTKIASRPTGEKLGDYAFFVDFDGTGDSARVQKLFEELGDVADIKILGEW